MHFWLVLWLIVAAAMIIAEMASLGLTTIWFAGGALVSALAAYLGAHWSIQVVCFAVVSVVMLVFTRPIVAKHMIKAPEKTNVEGLIGQRAVVKEAIDNLRSAGVVTINGLEWSARSADDEEIETGAAVEIVEVKGVKLIVKKVNKGV